MLSYSIREVLYLLSQKEAQELALLNILRDNPHPLGSVSISILLKDGGYAISAATVGRLLSEMDFRGFTAKYGYKGRVLTEDGTRRLDELCKQRELDAMSSKFYEAVDSQSKDDLIDVLTARRGIERRPPGGVARYRRGYRKAARLERKSNEGRAAGGAFARA